MRQLTCWLRATRCRLRLARARGTLAGAALLMLALGMSGLLFATLASSPAPARAAAVSPFKGRPTRTPRPTPTPTATAAPSPTPTAPGVVGPTAVPTAVPTAAPTAAATGISSPGASGAGQDGSGDGGTQADAAPLGGLAGWGLGAVIVGALGLAVCVVLLNRVTARGSRRAAFDPPAHSTTPARLNQLYHLLPTRQAAPPLVAEKSAEPPLEEDDNWQPLPPALETPPSAPLKPPRWMIEAGLLKEETGELPAEQPPES